MAPTGTPAIAREQERDNTRVRFGHFVIDFVLLEQKVVGVAGTLASAYANCFMRTEVQILLGHADADRCSPLAGGIGRATVEMHSLHNHMASMNWIVGGSGELTPTRGHTSLRAKQQVP